MCKLVINGFSRTFTINKNTTLARSLPGMLHSLIQNCYHSLVISEPKRRIDIQRANKTNSKMVSKGVVGTSQLPEIGFWAVEVPLAGQEKNYNS